MTGVNIKNTQIQKFDAQIEKSDILLMVDIHKLKIEAINTMIHHLHAKAQLAGTDPQIPAFL